VGEKGQEVTTITHLGGVHNYHHVRKGVSAARGGAIGGISVGYRRKKDRVGGEEGVFVFWVWGGGGGGGGVGG